MKVQAFAIIEHRGRVLLIQEATKAFRGKWHLPGGTLDPSESLVEALAREVKEEAAIELVPRELLFVDQVVAAKAGGKRRLRFVFRATPRSDKLKTDGDKQSLGARWFERAELAGVPLRSAFTSRMVELAATNPAALPVSAIECMSPRDRKRERREEKRKLP
jgi:8-oxo-dGTP diphosphatase